MDRRSATFNALLELHTEIINVNLHERGAHPLVIEEWEKILKAIDKRLYRFNHPINYDFYGKKEENT